MEVFERLANGPYRGRELTFRDEEAFRELWANGPVNVGEWEVTTERSPNVLAQFRLQRGASISVIEADGELVACTIWAPANCMIAGRRTSVSYAQGLRVRADRRRGGLGDLVRRFPPRALQNPAVGQVMFAMLGNVNLASFLEAVQFRAGEDRPQKVVAAACLTAKASDLSLPGVRPAEFADLARCAELINRTQAGLDLFAPYGAESLEAMLDGGVWGERPPWSRLAYGWADFHVLEDAGRIVACGGLWDRGRDVREIWRSTTGEERRVEVATALDLGCEEGRENDLADLLRHFASRTAALGRQSLIADLAHLPDVAQRLHDLDPSWEARTLEWAPLLPGAPKLLGECHLDLRYW